MWDPSGRRVGWSDSQLSTSLITVQRGIRGDREQPTTHHREPAEKTSRRPRAVTGHRPQPVASPARGRGSPNTCRPFRTSFLRPRPTNNTFCLLCSLFPFSSASPSSPYVRRPGPPLSSISFGPRRFVPHLILDRILHLSLISLYFFGSFGFCRPSLHCKGTLVLNIGHFVVF